MGELSPAEDVDPLSQVIALLKPQALQWRLVEAHDAWTLRFPAVDAVVFGQLIEGSCHVERSDGVCFDLHPGDFMLMGAPPAWTARPPGGGPPTDIQAYFDDPSCLRGASDQPTVTRFLAGYFAFAADNAGLLANLMLPVVHVRAAEVEAGPLSALLRLLGDEAVANRPGRALILDRLLEITLVEALRRRPATFDGARPGLLAGLADPQIGIALKLMHKDPQRAWTVADLARRSGMSRSAFAARFCETVDVPPIDYLSAWRMTLAKAALASSNKPLAEVAELAGYQSVSAFSTAFSRAIGCSPTTYIRRATQPGPSAAGGRLAS
jgi:AraC-like DNA-binding protein